jgi:hypothetical protein
LFGPKKALFNINTSPTIIFFSTTGKAGKDTKSGYDMQS